MKSIVYSIGTPSSRLHEDLFEEFFSRGRTAVEGYPVGIFIDYLGRQARLYDIKTSRKRTRSQPMALVCVILSQIFLLIYSKG
jgi:hypothetical protein